MKILFVFLVMFFFFNQSCFARFVRSEDDSDSNSTSLSLASESSTLQSVFSNDTRVTVTTVGTALTDSLVKTVCDQLAKLTAAIGKAIKWPKAAQNLDNLWTSIRQSDFARSPIALSAASVTLLGTMTMIALYAFPSLRQTNFWFADTELRRIGEIGRSIEEIAVTVNRAIDSYQNIEPQTCIMMALCTLGNAKQATRRRSRTIDTINTVLNFPGLDEFILSDKNWRESHAFGRNGGDCEVINMEKKCPFNYDTWKLLLSSLSSVI